MTVLTGMNSDYNDNSQIQLQAALHFLPWLEDALSNGSHMLPFSHSPLISYVDYGCATGSNTAQLFAKIKKLLESTRALGGVSSRFPCLQHVPHECHPMPTPRQQELSSTLLPCLSVDMRTCFQLVLCIAGWRRGADAGLLSGPAKQ